MVARRRYDDDADEIAWTLPVWARRVLKRLVPVLCPPDFCSRALTERIVDHAGLSLGALGRPQRSALLAGLRAYDWGALARYGRRSHALDEARALAWFERWRDTPGPTHELAKVLKGFLCMACYELPEVMDAIEYHPEAWVAEVARRRARYQADIDRHAQELFAADPLPRAPRPEDD